MRTRSLSLLFSLADERHQQGKKRLRVIFLRALFQFGSRKLKGGKGRGLIQKAAHHRMIATDFLLTVSDAQRPLVYPFHAALDKKRKDKY